MNNFVNMNQIRVHNNNFYDKYGKKSMDMRS